jgi:vancomycin resistance protein YoaR
LGGSSRGAAYFSDPPPPTPGTSPLTDTEHSDAPAGAPTDTAGAPAPSRPRARRLLIVLAAVPIVVVLALLAAWAVDDRGTGEVPRNTELAGEDIGGMGRSEVQAAAGRVAERYGTTDVVVETPEGDLSAPGADVGLAVDTDATVEAALAVGDDESALRRPFSWLASFFSPRRAPVIATVDEDRAARVVVERDPTDRRPPVEPSVRGEGGEIQVVPGEDGTGLGGAEVAGAIAAAAEQGRFPIVVEAEAQPIPPRFDEEAAAALAEEARQLTGEPIAVEGTAEVIPVEMQRDWVRSTATDDGLELTFDDDVRTLITAQLENHLGDLGDDPVDARLTVQGGSVTIVPARDGTACCEPEAGNLVVEAIMDPGTGSVALPLRARPAERTTEDVAALGIREPIGSFTTNFTPGQSRNQNIQRMADLVQGQVVEPGRRFSVNDHVGRRTREKGFTDGGEIRDGVLATAVGGGVSQFATTMFNAAFFAGLEIPEYQMHSLYFTRYPYGREATLSFPKPDLVIENNTGNGILLWPTHTSSSVTVTIYGTRTFEAAQTGQTTSPVGPCTRVVTQRTRTRLSTGAQTTDTFSNVYRPEEGVNC